MLYSPGFFYRIKPINLSESYQYEKVYLKG